MNKTMTKEHKIKLHTAMLSDNEHRCNSLNNYIHTDEYLTAEVVKVVEEIINEETKDLKSKADKAYSEKANAEIKLDEAKDLIKELIDPLVCEGAEAYDYAINLKIKAESFLNKE